MAQDIADDFSDGDFLNNPTWQGDTENFIVNDLQELQLMDDEGGQSHLYLPVQTADSVQWELLVRQEFAPSSSNFGEVILQSDNQDLNGSWQGYFLKIGGESGSTDALELYRKDGTEDVLLWRGNDGDLGGEPSGGRFRITRNEDGLWTIEGDLSGGSNFNQLGTVEDNAYNQGSIFGLRCTYTSTRADKFFFDDIRLGPLFQDEEPPVLLGAEAINDNQIELYFNEPLEESSVIETGNYSLDQGVGNPSNVELQPDQSSVLLSFTESFSNGIEYIVSSTNIEDLNGNVSGEQGASFLYVNPAPGDFKEVVFNEILADPTPLVGLPDAEFVELHNPTDQYFQLEEWVFVNTQTEEILPEFLLEPGGFVILCDQDNEGLLASFGNVLALNSFAALSNGGDSLTLRNADDLIIDWVVYSDDWYNDPDKEDGGYSLELINPSSPCTGPINWSASESSLGGTPGIQNSIFNDAPDEGAPELLDYIIQSPSEIVLEFSETMDDQSLLNGSFTWSEGIQTIGVQIIDNSEAIVLSISPSLQSGILYELSIDNVLDCWGNAIISKTIEILIGEIPQYGELIISEIMVDPTPTQLLPDAEYFELVNIGKRALELSGLSLNDIEFNANQILFPGNYLIFIDKEYLEFYPDAYVLEALGGTYFTNTGRDVRLFNQMGDLLDRVNYTDSWYNDPERDEGGFSLERKNLMEICRAEDNWQASQASEGGTPGIENSVFTTEADTTPPLAISVQVVNGQLLEIKFNEPIDSLSLEEILFQFNPAVELAVISNLPPEYRSISVELDKPIQAGQIYNVIISEFSDCTGNIQEEALSFDFGLPEPALPGDIVINEILFNPRTGGSDFVEIVNISEKVVSIQNWLLENADGTSELITDEPRSLLPGNYLVLTKDLENIMLEYPLSVRENIFQMNNTPSFNNGEGRVILLDQSLVVIDSFEYEEDFHFELLSSVKGVSLERLSFTRPTNDPGNWLSAAESVGFATPGYLNSQFNPEGTAGSFFELESEIFSPDNDGFQDVLLINYRLNQSGAVATIKVFDRRGREIRDLSNNLFLGTEGTITWDGITDQGTKARIGPHLVYIEVFTADGFTEIEKLPCIVAGKLSN